MGYVNTFIAVAPDCPVPGPVEPPAVAARPSVARVQYDVLRASPGMLTEEEVLAWSGPDLRGQADVTDEELARVVEGIDSRPHACLRTSPLPKRYGWGLHYDSEGRITLHGVGTDEYAAMSQDPALVQLVAMRSRR